MYTWCTHCFKHLRTASVQLVLSMLQESLYTWCSHCYNCTCTVGVMSVSLTVGAPIVTSLCTQDAHIVTTISVQWMLQKCLYCWWPYFLSLYNGCSYCYESLCTMGASIVTNIFAQWMPTLLQDSVQWTPQLF